MTASSETASRSRRSQEVGLNPSAFGKVNPSELGIRFAFGALVSIAAAVIGLAFGSREGGLFLAFPAILPAALTLIEKRDSRSDARDDCLGAIAGAAGLIAFAVVMALLITRQTSAAAIMSALVAWIVVSLAAWLCLRATLRRLR